MFHVTIMASRRNGALYIAMADDLNRRVWQHQPGVVGSRSDHLIAEMDWEHMVVLRSVDETEQLTPESCPGPRS